MITTIIFSKNRACQLDALLRSMEHHFGNISIDIRVLYKATADKFHVGYSKVKDRFPDVCFVEESIFQIDTTCLIDSSNSHVCFFVDDNIVYRKPKIACGHIVELLKMGGAGCFSFRLGLNTTIQDPYTQSKVNPWPLMEYISANDTEIICGWDWTRLPMNNFGYPFSVDGHVYNKEVVLRALDFEFDTPNAFEGRFPIDHIPPVMMCLEQSSVVNNPLNLVGSSQNKAGMYYPHTLAEMNEKYLAGSQINLQKLYANDIIGCHQEMEIEYE